MEVVSVRGWQKYLAIGAGPIAIAGFATLTIMGYISWMILPLIASIMCVEMAATSVFTLKGRSRSIQATNFMPLPNAALQQASVIPTKTVLTADEVANLPHIIVTTEDSEPRIDSVSAPPLMASSTGGIYIDSIDLVRQQISKVKLQPECRGPGEKKGSVEKKEKAKNQEKQKIKT